jgi:uncharacterized MAPEG superfamily protein
MTTELFLLAWTLVLAVVQVLLPAFLRTQETGLPYGAGPRDAPSPASISQLTGRLMRAQSNLFETLPLFIAAILIAHVANLDGPLTYWGAMLYFWARVIYVPLYAFGISYVRTIVWFASFVGLVLLLVAILHPVQT